MSFLFKRAERRSIDYDDVPWSPTSQWSGGSPRELTDLIPVYASINLIANAISTLPLHQFRETPDGRPERMPASGILATRTALADLIQWLQRPLVSCLTRGNALGLKVGASDVPADVIWLSPDKVTEGPGSSWLYEGKRIEAEQMVHIPALSVAGERLGVSPMTAARTAMQSGIAAQQFMTDWNTNRAIPSLVLKNKNAVLNASQSDTIATRIKSKIKTGQPVVVGADWDLDTVSIGAADAGFVATARLSASQIAAIYSVPPERIGGEKSGSMTYSNLEMDELRFITDSLHHWIIKLEAAISALLPAGQYVKFNTDARLRVDVKTRWSVHATARAIGTKSANEIRALEELEPIEGGDDYTPLRSTAGQESL